MSYEENVKKFLKQVDVIKKLKPAYKQPGDGSNGTCDCIGLVIGAVRRMGLKWTGIHGSNWAARKEFVELKKINSVKNLKVGDVVLKAYEKGHSKWKLPSRYQKGGAYYNGDLKDYYHAGVVTSVNPLNITHMTSPTVKVDTKLGAWGYYGELNLLQCTDIKTSAPVSGTPTTGNLTQVPTAGCTAIVTAPSGKYVKMRQYPSTSCRTWDNVPVGARVTIIDPGEKWAQISYGKRKGWYMQAQYLLIEK